MVILVFDFLRFVGVFISSILLNRPQSSCFSTYKAVCRYVENDFATKFSCFRSNIYDSICSPHNFLFMLYNDNRIPKLLKVLSTPMRFSVSLGCNPIDGSSKIYIEPTSELPKEGQDNFEILLPTTCWIVDLGLNSRVLLYKDSSVDS